MSRKRDWEELRRRELELLIERPMTRPDAAEYMREWKRHNADKIEE